jgi:lactaldehyde reductase
MRGVLRKQIRRLVVLLIYAVFSVAVLWFSLLPAALRANREVREADIARLGEVMCGRTFDSTSSAAAAAAEKVEELCSAAGIPRKLSEIGVKRDDLPAIVKSSYGNSMSGNPRKLSEEELGLILESML